MKEKPKDQPTDAEGIGTGQLEEVPEEGEALTGKENFHKEPPSDNHKRGRMIAAGFVVTVTLSVVAILVAGIFQLTSKWLLICPRDLPVNDPAPILWNYLTAEKASPKSLGVPEKLMPEAGFKLGPQ